MTLAITAACELPPRHAPSSTFPATSHRRLQARARHPDQGGRPALGLDPSRRQASMLPSTELRHNGASLRPVATIGSADRDLLLVKGDIAGVIVPDSFK
jgi:hypothetical protein